MNVYVNVGCFGDVLCPDNDKILILSRDGVSDSEVQLQEEARRTILERWATYCKRNSFLSGFSWLLRNIKLRESK